MPVLRWKQDVHGNKLTMNYCGLKGPNMKLARSAELQTAKFKMYASVAMVTILPYQQVT